MKKISSKLNNISLTFISIFIPLLLSDLFLKKQWLPSNYSSGLLISNYGISTDKNNVRRFLPNLNYRQAKTSKDILVYDYFFKTDPYGFRLTYKCNNKFLIDNKNLVISGDSFTDGTGSSIVWTMGIQENLCQKGIYSVNTAMSGYGVMSMADALLDTKNKLNSSHAIIAITEADVVRLRKKYVTLKNCSINIRRTSNIKNPCRAYNSWLHIENEWNENKIINYVKRNYSIGLYPSIKDLMSKIKYQIAIRVKISKNGIALKPKNNYDLVHYKIVDESIKAANDVINEFGVDKTLFILLPHKELALDLPEPYNSQKRREKLVKYFFKNLKENVLVANLNNCELNKLDFHKLDGHPNEKGHIKLSKCSLEDKKIMKFVSEI